jgi:hypothetical protein
MNLPVQKEPFGIHRVTLAITIGQWKGKTVEYGEMKMEQAAVLAKQTTRNLHHQFQRTIKNQPAHREKAPLQRHSSHHHQAAVLALSLNHHPVAAVLRRRQRHPLLRLLLRRHHHLLPLLPPQVSAVQHLQQVVVLEVTNNQLRLQTV